MTDPELTTSDSEQTIEIVRDSTFTRFVADEAIVSSLGRDLEVSFIQYGPIHNIQTDHGDFESVESTSVLTEVARMRMAYGAMVTTVMQFLQGGIKDGRLKKEAIIRSINEWESPKGDEEGK